MRALIPSSLIAVTALALGLVSCGGTQGPAKPKPGTPAFLWENAQQSIKKGNFVDASNQLDKLTGKDGEFRDRAALLQIVIATGIAHGEMDWGDVWEEGSKSARERHMDFKRSAFTVRTTANQMVMRAAEITHSRLAALKDGDLAMTATLPTLSVELPVEAERVKKGVALQTAEKEAALTKMQQRGVLKAFALFAGAGKDMDKARELLAKADFKIPKDTFLIGTANQYIDLADMYGSKKLDQSGQVKLLCSEADAALAAATASADVKALQKKLAAIRAKADKK